MHANRKSPHAPCGWRPRRASARVQRARSRAPDLPGSVPEQRWAPLPQESWPNGGLHHPLLIPAKPSTVGPTLEHLSAEISPPCQSDHQLGGQWANMSQERKRDCSGDITRSPPGRAGHRRRRPRAAARRCLRGRPARPGAAASRPSASIAFSSGPTRSSSFTTCRRAAVLSCHEKALCSTLCVTACRLHALPPAAGLWDNIRWSFDHLIRDSP